MCDDWRTGLIELSFRFEFDALVSEADMMSACASINSAEVLKVLCSEHEPQIVYQLPEALKGLTDLVTNIFYKYFIKPRLASKWPVRWRIEYY
jgi:hypothetical protein